MMNVSMLQPEVSVRKFFLRVLASCVAMIALDLLLNAGLFAKLWFEPDSFLLPPAELFRRIPLGYLAFLVLAVAYVWLAITGGVRTWRQGSLFGLKLGAVLNIAFALSLRSATTARWTTLLVAWLFGGTVLATGACAMAGLASERGERRALLIATLLLIGALVVIVLLQSLGFVPVRHFG